MICHVTAYNLLKFLISIVAISGQFRFVFDARVNPRDKTPPYEAFIRFYGTSEYDFCIAYFIMK